MPWDRSARGGGIYLEGELPATISNSVVTKNSASTEGDDIYGPYSAKVVQNFEPLIATC